MKSAKKLVTAELAYLRWERRLFRACREMRRLRKIIQRQRRALDLGVLVVDRDVR